METAPRRTILIHEYATGGGLAGKVGSRDSWLVEGSAMRRAVAADFAAVPGIHVKMTLDARLPDEPGPWEPVRVASGRDQEALGRLASEADGVVLIAPETDGILLERARRIEQVGGRSLGSTLGALALCGDKALLGHHLASLGLPTPRFQLVRPALDLPREFPYPAVLKPIDGAGSVDTFAIGGADRLPPAASKLGTSLLQPYQTGVPLGVSFLAHPGREPTFIALARQRIEIKDGRFHYLGGTIPFAPISPVIDLARRAVAGVKGLRGWVGVDVLWNEAEAKATILEINPRVTTSFVGLQDLSRGAIARAWLAALDGDSQPESFDFSASPPRSFLPDGTVRIEGPTS